VKTRPKTSQLQNQYICYCANLKKTLKHKGFFTIWGLPITISFNLQTYTFLKKITLTQPSVDILNLL